jgi:hypothetical protein
MSGKGRDRPDLRWALMPGTEFVNLERALSAFRVGPEAIVEKRWAVTQALERVNRDAAPGVWWRVRYEDGSTFFIRISPEGETRTSEPPAPCDIRELPMVSDVITCREVLSEVARRCDNLNPPHPRYAEMLAISKKLLSGDVAARRESVGQMAALMEKVRNGIERPEWLTGVKDLYETCFFNFALDCHEFSCAMALLQLQGITNRWIQADWFDDPDHYLASYYFNVASDSTSRQHLIDASVEMADAMVGAARNDLLLALRTSLMAPFPRKLMLAYHRFRCASLVQKLSVNIGAAPSVFESPPHVTEEGEVCMESGILTGAWLCALSPHDILYDLGLRALTPAEIWDEVKNYSCPHLPVFPNGFAKILAAYAGFFAGDASGTIDELLHYDNEFGRCVTDVAYEEAWVEKGLLDAYRDLGNDLSTRYAGRIAAKLLVMGHLGHEKT